jgi:DNA-binding transcriptional LysR family regulator
MRDRTLLLYEGGNTRRAIDAWLAAPDTRIRPAMEFGSIEAIKELVAVGLGWSILPGLALKRDRAGLVTTSSLNPRLTRRLGMVLRRDKHLTRGLREMMKCLRAFKG